jgi:hypothetical protein
MKINTYNLESMKHSAISRKVTGSILDGVVGVFNWPDRSSLIMTLEPTQTVTEMNTRNVTVRKRRLAHKAENLSATYGPVV